MKLPCGWCTTIMWSTFVNLIFTSFSHTNLKFSPFLPALSIKPKCSAAELLHYCYCNCYCCLIVSTSTVSTLVLHMRLHISMHPLNEPKMFFHLCWCCWCYLGWKEYMFVVHICELWTLNIAFDSYSFIFHWYMYRHIYFPIWFSPHQANAFVWN